MKIFNIDFDFQIHFFSIYMNKYSAYGFEFLSFENRNNDRSLISIMYDVFGARFFVDLFWFRLIVYLKYEKIN